VSSAPRSTYVPHIDGLRAVAVLSVILYHLNERWLPGGFSGVDIFFVISGFVVSASVAELKKTSPLGFFGYFYARRILRIVPALVVCLVVTHIATMLFVPWAWLSSANDRTGLYAFFGLSNFILAYAGNDYFSPTSDFNPYTHTWSLGVEEQFYLITPLFMLFAWRFLPKHAKLLFAVVAALSLAAAYAVSHRNQTFVFYLTPFRAWELALGALLAIKFIPAPKTDFSKTFIQTLRSAIAPASLRHETIPHFGLFIIQAPSLGESPFEHLFIRAPLERFLFQGGVINMEEVAAARIETSFHRGAAHRLPALRKFPGGSETNLVEHASEIDESFHLGGRAAESRNNCRIRLRHGWSRAGTCRVRKQAENR